MKEKDIVYEIGSHWVLITKRGYYEIYRDGFTYATRRAIIGYKGKVGLQKAIEKANELENLTSSS